MSRAHLLFAALAFAAALPLAAAEEPEAAYAKFHRAMVAGDLDEMLKYGTDAQRAEMAAMSPAQKAASLKMMAAIMPRAFVLKDKSVAPDGQSARLVLSGQGPVLLGDKPETLYGTIRMAMQGGGWKVLESSWSNTVPPMSRPAPKPAPQAAPAPAAKAAAKAPAQSRTTPPVGSLDAPPERKLGAQKPPCVYKPVMTAEDLENCR